MARDNIIGGDPVLPKGKSCAHCGDGFGVVEFSSFMAQFWNNNIFCHNCQTGNYLEASSNLGVRIALGLLSILAGLAFFIGVQWVIGGGSSNGSVRVSLWTVYGAAVGGAAITRGLMAFFRWISGRIEPLDSEDGGFV